MQNRAYDLGTPTESATSNTQAQKADHHVLRVRIKMRSGAHASSRQDTDYAGAVVVRSYDPGSVTRGPACLTSVCIQGDMKDATRG
jgi:hypothetical protein